MKYLIYLFISLIASGQCFATEWDHIISPDTLRTSAFYIGDNGDVYLGYRGLYKMNLETGESRYLNEYDYGNEYKDDNFTDNFGEWPTIYKTQKGNLLASMYTSTDDGNSWINSLFESGIGGYRQVFEYKEKLYAFGSKLIVSNDDGLSWKVQENIAPDYRFNKIIKFDQDNGECYFLGTHTETKNNAIVVFNVSTLAVSIIEINIDNLDPYIINASYKENVYYVNDYNKVWTSKDQGITWEEYLSFADVKENPEEKWGWLMFSEDEYLFYSTTYEEEISDNYYEQHHYTYISSDNGTTWKKSNNLIHWSGTPTKKNGKFYILSNSLYEYDAEEQDFVLTKYQFPGKGNYRQFDNMEVYNGWSQNFERETNSEWTFVDNYRRYRFDGSYYQVVDSVLQFVSLDGTVTNLAEVRYYGLKTSYTGRDVLVCISKDNTVRITLIVENGQILSEFNTDLNTRDMLDVGKDYHYYLDHNRVQDDIALQVQKTHLITQETDIIELPLDFNYIENFAWQDEKAMVISGITIYISTNDGTDWKNIITQMPEVRRWGYNVAIFNDNFYLYGSLGLLRSSDGETWENLLEGVTTANVYDVEMDYEGRIYANTYEGHFISKEPIGVEENKESTKEISINLFPNPAFDYLQYSFDSNIESVSLINLNGKSFNTESNGNQIDISNLSSGTYFLKIKSDGRAFLKQFVVAR